MSPNDISDFVEGATKGFLNWSTEQIKNQVNRFLNKELLFIGEQETIQILKEQRSTIEWEIYTQFITDKKLRILIEMGLTLRAVEKDNTKNQNLRAKIIKAYQPYGLHVAEFVQSDFLGKFFGSMLSKTKKKNELMVFIEEILINVDKYVLFVKENDNAEKKSSEVVVRIQANLPHSFIITGYKSGRTVARKVKDLVVVKVKDDYNSEIYEDNLRFACFLSKKQNL